MFNDGGSPVSLFSFQDIITSLTGIMIFFLLLLSLNVLEESSQKTDLSSTEKELALIRKKNEVHKKHIREISDDISSYMMRIKSAAAQDESTLAIKRYNLKKQISNQKAKIEKLKQKLITEKGLLHQAENQKKELADKLSKIEMQLAQKDMLVKYNKDKKNQISKIREEIKKKKRSVSITIASDLKRHPILVECSSSMICIYDKVANKKIISRRCVPMVSQVIAEVIKKISLFSPNKYYFIFLVKPSAVHYMSYFISCFQLEIKNAVWGIEPIYETERIANE